RSGELEQVATPREIYSRPATAYVAQFIGHTNLLRCTIAAGVARCGLLSWKTGSPEGPALFSLRPEHIRLGRSTPDANSVSIRGRIIHRAFHGATELLRVECTDGLILVVRIATGMPAPGQSATGQIELEFSAADAVAVRESPERN